VSFLRRDRVISVRLSQHEYDQLDQLSRKQGASSVSDFVRRMLTNSVLSSLVADDGSAGVLAQLAVLQQQMDWLSRLVRTGDPEKGQVAVSPDPDAVANPLTPRP